MRSSRKRKRESPEITVPKADHENGGTPPTETELDVWEAFREEYVESVEQLPLSIHRNFSLMNEIDAQAHLLQASLPTNVREYIRERQSLRAAHGSIKNNSRQDAAPYSPFGPHGIGEAPSCTGKTLSSISSQVIELLRAAEEKVNLAQATYDSIDRHVRLLDQTIKEHELESKKEILANEAHPNLVLTTSSISARRDSSDNSQMSTRSDGRRGADRNVRVRDAGRTRRALRGRSPISIVSASPSGHDPNNNRQTARRAKDKSSVHPIGENTLQRDTGSQGPGSTVVLSAGDMPIDPNEPRYCYCGQVSWGVMIACDAGGCEGEWFHLGCVGLSKAPERGKWYCDVCKEKNLLGRRRRGQ